MSYTEIGPATRHCVVRRSLAPDVRVAVQVESRQPSEVDP